MSMVIQYLKEMMTLIPKYNRQSLKKTGSINELVVITQQILFIERYLTDN